MDGLRVAVPALLLAALAACGSASPPASPSAATPSAAGSALLLTVRAPDLAAGTFPRDLTCDGAGHAPAVSWTPLDARTRAMVVEMLDPDAPGGTFVHWLQFTDTAAASTTAIGWVQGAGSAGSAGYRGPCPPAGQTHHYHLVVSELATALGGRLQAGFTASQLDSALQSATVLRRGELVAQYGR